MRVVSTVWPLDRKKTWDASDGLPAFQGRLYRRLLTSVSGPTYELREATHSAIFVAIWSTT